MLSDKQEYEILNEIDEQIRRSDFKIYDCAKILVTMLNNTTWLDIRIVIDKFVTAHPDLSYARYDFTTLDENGKERTVWTVFYKKENKNES